MTGTPQHVVGSREQFKIMAIFFGLFLSPYFIYTRIDHLVPMLVDILTFPALVVYGWLLARRLFADKQFRDPGDEQFDVRGNGVVRGVAFISMLGIAWGRWVWDHRDALSETTMNTVLAIQGLSLLVLVVSGTIWAVMSTIAWRRRRRARAVYLA